jgi:hypothetical protein
MTADALRNLLKQQPFEPFQLILSSGDKYAVKHPENVLVLKNRALVAVDPEVIDDDPDQYVTVSYLHLAGAEPLPPEKRRKIPGY